MAGTSPAMTATDCISPDTIFCLSLVLKMAATAGPVVGAAMMVAKALAPPSALSSPRCRSPPVQQMFLSGSITTSAFISASAISSIAWHASTAVFSLAYVVLAQRAPHW